MFLCQDTQVLQSAFLTKSQLQCTVLRQNLHHGTFQIPGQPRHAQILLSPTASARDYSPQRVNNRRMKCMSLTYYIDYVS